MPKHPERFIITAAQLQALGDFLARLPWKDVHPIMQLLSQLPAETPPMTVPSTEETGN
jgi:hypothetical protein